MLSTLFSKQCLVIEWWQRLNYICKQADWLIAILSLTRIIYGHFFFGSFCVYSKVIQAILSIQIQFICYPTCVLTYFQFFTIEFIILCSKIRCSRWIHRKSINLIEMRWIDEKSEFMIFFFKKSQDFFFVGHTQSHTSILFHNGFFMHVEHIFSIEMLNFYGCNEYTYQIYPLDVQVLLIEFLWSPKMFIISMDKYPTWTYKKP